MSRKREKKVQLNKTHIHLREIRKTSLKEITMGRDYKSKPILIAMIPQNLREILQEI